MNAVSPWHLAQHLPADCRICRQWGAGSLCAHCTQRFCTFRPRCAKCGLALSAGREDMSICTACMRQPPVWRRAVCAQDYDFPWSGLISEFKFQEGVGLAGLLAERLSSAVRKAPHEAEVDLVVPIPLSARRLQDRGFNQAWELARRVACALGVPAEADLLQRPVDTAHQVELSLEERSRNLRGAFMVSPQGRHHVPGRRIALVDDVMTTGATFREAAKILFEAGAAEVDVWAVARTP